MHRFFARLSDIGDERIVLTEDEANHATRVLRLRVGANVKCFDGEGRSWEGTIVELGKTQVVVGDLVALPVDPIERPRIALAQSVLKPEKMDLVVQKATELGAWRLVPVLAERGVGGDPTSKRLERWRRISLEAAKQCERNRLMIIDEPLSVASFLAGLSGLAVGLVERSEAPELPSMAGEESVSLLVGPEGGWTDEELDTMRTTGVVEASLGRRILRAETAAIVGLGLVEYLANR